MLQDSLTVFGIGEDDLIANRRGSLGASQVRKLRRRASVIIGQTAGLSLLLLVVVVAVAEHPFRAVQWVLLAAIICVASTVCVVQWRRFDAAIRSGTIECVIGSIQPRLHGKSGQFLHVQDRSFRLYRQFAYDPNASYRVYVVPRIDRIVGVELSDATHTSFDQASAG